MKNIFITLLKFLLAFLIFTIAYVMLFRLGFFGEWILFYRGIILLVAAFFISALIIFLLQKRFGFFDFASSFSGLVASLSLHLSFFVVVPVTIDRSQTTFLIQQLDRSSSPISKTQMESDFVQKYIFENDAIGRRIDEQIRSGNFAEESGGYVITKQGRDFLSFSRLVLNIFKIHSSVVEEKK